jgi:hypothetical protein
VPEAWGDVLAPASRARGSARWVYLYVFQHLPYDRAAQALRDIAGATASPGSLTERRPGDRRSLRLLRASARPLTWCVSTARTSPTGARPANHVVAPGDDGQKRCDPRTVGQHHRRAHDQPLLRDYPRDVLRRSRTSALRRRRADGSAKIRISEIVVIDSNLATRRRSMPGLGRVRCPRRSAFVSRRRP